uniref:Uncharacterized protein n=1 Tax=Anguilla anguilla TaxID=7936 RepID=A0A0E9P6M0_ANGAN
MTKITNNIQYVINTLCNEI